jgi:DNA-directed RNA polymerase I subunit RPA1
MWKAAEHIADLNRMYSNDISSTLRTYGVEMARASIVQEIDAVFEVYKISVDKRHLELIADYMVRFDSTSFDRSLTSTYKRLSTADLNPSIEKAYQRIVHRF